IRDTLLKYVHNWKGFSPETTGHDLQARNLMPGPQYNQILSSLRIAWLDGVITSSEEESLLLEQLIQ
ncbi:MAG: hypothetical protein IZT55_04465, partial [Anaerolineae bacterium]|nr:hypothetical protein [Anaerolineae bacterium]